MHTKKSGLTWLQKGAVSLSTVLTITLVVVGVYLAFKVNTHEERIKTLETKVISGAAQGPVEADSLGRRGD